MSLAIKQPALPAWHSLIDTDNPAWIWQGAKLCHIEAGVAVREIAPRSQLRRFVLDHFYATQNRSRRVQQKLDRLLRQLSEGDWGLNLGAGSTALHHRVINLDICDLPSVDVVARGQLLPFKQSSLQLIVSQEVFEHLPDPCLAVSEAHRVLRAEGFFYCQVPFVIGYHPGPSDFWRFTREGLAQLFAAPRWRILELGISLGHGSGFYRIAVEYAAVNCSLIHRSLYLPAKALAAIFLAPLKIPDLFAHRTDQQDRIPGGYYCIAQKVA